MVTRDSRTISISLFSSDLQSTEKCLPRTVELAIFHIFLINFELDRDSRTGGFYLVVEAEPTSMQLDLTGGVGIYTRWTTGGAVY